MATVKTFNLPSCSVLSVPATARVVVSRKVDGSLDIQSTLEEEDTINLLDEAMEAIDGQRLPPDSNSSNSNN